MKLRLLPVVVLSCILGGLVIYLHETATRQQLARATHEAKSRRSTAEAEAKHLSDRLAETEKSLGTLKEKLAKTTPALSPKAAAPVLNIQQRLDEDPRLQLLNARARKNAIRFSYGAFFRSRNLSPEQTSAFENALLKREEDQNDAIAVMRAQGLSVNDPAIGTLMQKTTDEYAKAQTVLLGENGYKELQEYDRTLQLREILAGIAGTATTKGIDFPASQAEKLLSIMAVTSESYQKGGWASIEQMDWELVDAQAQQILSPEQFWAFQNLPSSGYHYTNSRGITRLNTAITKAAEADKAGTTGAKPAGG